MRSGDTGVYPVLVESLGRADRDVDVAEADWDLGGAPGVTCSLAAANGPVECTIGTLPAGGDGGERVRLRHPLSSRPTNTRFPYYSASYVFPNSADTHSHRPKPSNVCKPFPLCSPSPPYLVQVFGPCTAQQLKHSKQLLGTPIQSSPSHTQCINAQLVARFPRKRHKKEKKST